MKRLNFAQLTTDRSSGIVNYQLNLCKRTKAWTAEEEAACMTRIAAHDPGYEKLAAINIKNISSDVDVDNKSSGASAMPSSLSPVFSSKRGRTETRG